MIRRTARHLPHDGLQHLTHSNGSFELVADFFLPLVNVGWRDSYCSLTCNRRTQTRRCLRVRESAALSAVWGESYSSSGALQRARAGSFLFIEQYHFGGSFRSSTTPRRRLHFLHLSHSTQVELLAPVVWPKILPSSRSCSIGLSPPDDGALLVLSRVDTPSSFPDILSLSLRPPALPFDLLVALLFFFPLGPLVGLSDPATPSMTPELELCRISSSSSSSSP
mmetsp:Transcript_45704/g.111367  ORF Transcript_45704/g.111367 Transcript_45704/m.111367 type:complete len:223 (+) Transcript_45704:322-990(+)